jgi:hypothetical protein
MHAAEYDVLGVRLRRHDRKLIRIARQISVADHIVSLVMVTENDDAWAESFTRRLDLHVQLVVGHNEKIFECPYLFKYC